MDEPPRDNFSICLASIILAALLDLTEENKASSDFCKVKGNPVSKLFNHIICVIRQIHSPFTRLVS